MVSETNLEEILSKKPNNTYREFSRAINWVIDSLAYLFSYRPKLRSKDFEEFRDYLDTSSKANATGSWVFDYTPDVGEHWQKPEETFNRRSPDGDMMGDCEDLAILLTYCLNHNELETYVLAMWGKDKKGELSGHATSYLPKFQQTIGTFGRIDHGTDDIDMIAQYWYPELMGWTLYKIKEDGSWERVDGRIVVGASAEKNEEFERFVRKMKIVDPEFEKLVNRSIKMLKEI